MSSSKYDKPLLSPIAEEVSPDERWEKLGASHTSGPKSSSSSSIGMRAHRDHNSKTPLGQGTMSSRSQSGSEDPSGKGKGHALSAASARLVTERGLKQRPPTAEERASMSEIEREIAMWQFDDNEVERCLEWLKWETDRALEDLQRGWREMREEEQQWEVRRRAGCAAKK